MKGRMALSNVVSGHIEQPLRVLIYGVEGVGKTSTAAGAPKPIFLGSEDGTAQLSVSRFPEPTDWADAVDAITTLTNEQHDYQSFVIDTLDWLEPLCWRHAVAKANKKGVNSIEDFGFGRGYLAALEEWRVLVAALDRLRRTKAMNIILLAHASIRPFNDPSADSAYDRYELKIHKLAAALFKEWSDAVLFAKFETFITKNDAGKTKAVGSGARTVHTEHCAAFDAKNRYSLPAEIPLSWHDLTAAIKANSPTVLHGLRQEIERLIPSIPDDTKRINAALWLAQLHCANAAVLRDGLARIHNLIGKETNHAAS